MRIAIKNVMKSKVPSVYFALACLLLATLLVGAKVITDDLVAMADQTIEVLQAHAP